MTYANRGVNIDEEVLETNDLIREVIQETDPMHRTVHRSGLVETLMAEWNEDRLELLLETDPDELDDDLAERVREWREAHPEVVEGEAGNEILALASS